MKFNFDPASRKLMDIIIRWIVVALVLKDNNNKVYAWHTWPASKRRVNLSIICGNVKIFTRFKDNNKMNLSTTKGGGSHLMDWHLAVIRCIQIINFS